MVSRLLKNGLVVVLEFRNEISSLLSGGVRHEARVV